MRCAITSGASVGCAAGAIAPGGVTAAAASSGIIPTVELIAASTVARFDMRIS
jgi:hypothetical protein